MKVTKNYDGTVTVTIPRTTEVYDPASGELVSTETLSADEYRDALKAEKGVKDAERAPTEDEKREALERIADEAARKAIADEIKARPAVVPLDPNDPSNAEALAASKARAEAKAKRDADAAAKAKADKK